MRLVELAAHVDEVVAHLNRCVGHLGQIGVLTAKLAAGFVHLVVEQRIARSVAPGAKPAKLLPILKVCHCAAFDEKW